MNRLTLFLLLLTSAGVLAQVPEIQGNTLLCPETCGTFSVGTADSYRWFSRPFGSDVTTLIDTATGPQVTICNRSTDGLIPLYLSAELVRGTDTLTTRQVLVDGLVFLLPVVETTGSFTIGDEGQTLLCAGDTISFQLLDRTATSVTWFESGNAIEGENDAKLVVTEPGTYTVDSAPGQCPDFVMPLGLNLVVERCTSTSIPGLDQGLIAPPYPNPTTGVLIWPLPTEATDIPSTVYDAFGRTLWHGEAGSLTRDFELTNYPAGTYFLRLSDRIFTLVKH